MSYYAGTSFERLRKTTENFSGYAVTHSILEKKNT
jgi:hypothetical protein